MHYILLFFIAVGVIAAFTVFASFKKNPQDNHILNALRDNQNQKKLLFR